MFVCVRSEYAQLCNNTKMLAEVDCIKENCSEEFGKGFGMYKNCVENECNVNIPGIKSINYWNCHQFEEKSVCKYGREVYKQLGEANLGCHDFEEHAFAQCTNRSKVQDRLSMDICVRDKSADLCSNNTEMQNEVICIKDNCDVKDYDVDMYYKFGIYSKCVSGKCNASTPNSAELKINFWNCHQFEGYERIVCKHGRALYEELLKEGQGCELFEALAFLDCTKKEEVNTTASMDDCLRAEYDSLCRTSHNIAGHNETQTEWDCISKNCTTTTMGLDFNTSEENASTLQPSSNASEENAINVTTV